MTAYNGPAFTQEEMDWLREYFIDTYNDDFMSNYQLELIGDVPAAVLLWAGCEQFPL